MKHLLLTLTILLTSGYVHAQQSCSSNVTYTNVCTGGKAKGGSAVCTNTTTKTVSYSKCTAQNTIASDLNSACIAANACTPPPPANCTFNGATVLHGSNVTAYLASSVAYGGTCSSQVRTCNNGVLSGTYANPSCSVQPAANCSFNGATVSHGSSVTAYLASSVAYGGSCTSEARTCNNGVLSGSYAQNSCSVQAPADCSFNGATVLHGANVTAYLASSVPYGGTCSSQVRTCSNGVLSGNFANVSCSVQPGADCSFNGTTIANGSSVTAFLASSVAYGGTCSSEARICTDGTLSGSYAQNSCTVQAPADCSFNGAPVAHGSSVTAYLAASVPYGQTCSSEARSCSNGTLSGTYGQASCTVQPQVYTYTIRAPFMSYTTEGSVTKVQWGYYALEPFYCYDMWQFFKAGLNPSDPKNVAFFAANPTPPTGWKLTTIKCLSNGAHTDYDNEEHPTSRTSTYPDNCYIDTVINSGAPNPQCL